MEQTPTAPVLEFKPEVANPLVQEVMERSGQPLVACYQCRRCAAGCPVGEETGYITPDRLVRIIVLGDREKALSNALVWQCVSCYTCGTRCPNEIMTGRITETLKKMAKEAHIEPLKPKVAYFHDTFVKSGLRWGRLNEGEFISFYELKNFFKDISRFRFKTIYDEIVSQTKLALSMMGRKRLHFGIQTSKGRKELKRLYQKSKAKTQT
jgi:heterodisulfide reductase subunit C